jgi:cytochrome c-type biogenesis protein CcmH/NrfG
LGLDVMKHPLLCLLTLAIFILGSVGVATMASPTTTTTVTHTRARITTTTTLTETTTATTNSVGVKAYFVLVVLLGAAASIAVVGGYVWGRRRARKALLRASA